MSRRCQFLPKVLALFFLVLLCVAESEVDVHTGLAPNKLAQNDLAPKWLEWPIYKIAKIEYGDETITLAREDGHKKNEFSDGLEVHPYSTDYLNQGFKIQLRSTKEEGTNYCIVTLYDSNDKPLQRGSITWIIGHSSYRIDDLPLDEPDTGRGGTISWVSIAIVMTLVLFVGLRYWRPRGGSENGSRSKQSTKRRVKPVAGSWSTVAHLANGGLAEVRLVRKNAFAPRHIMKILKAHYADDAAFVKALHYETDVLRHLEASGVRRVPRLIAASWERPDAGGEIWYVMTRMPWVTLKNANLSTSTLRARLRLIAAIATTLSECHAAEVVHRDLSPDNIMVRPGAGCRFAGLVDFGSASLQRRRHPLGRKWVLKQRFAAPEQLQQGLDVAGPAADVYSLGIVACELLLGCHPFASEGQLPRLEDHLGFNRVQLAERMTQGGLRAEVAQAICCVMLAADPASRGTMRLLLTVLRGAYPFLR